VGREKIVRSLSLFPLMLLALLLTAPRASYARSRPLEFQSLYEYLGVITTGDLLQSHTTAAGDYVFRDQESWCAFWSAAIVLAGPSSCPQIDFRHDTVIASIAGPQPSSCFGIQIDAIERHPGRAVEVGVLHTERIPNGSCGCLTVVVNPVEIVVVSAPIGAVEFVHEDVQTTGCGCGFGLVNGDVQPQCGFAIGP
jgi:hypothetical protein